MTELSGKKIIGTASAVRQDHYLAILEGLAERGWAVCDLFLPGSVIKDLCREAADLWLGGNLKRAAVGTGSDAKILSEIRRDFIFWLDPDALSHAQQSYWQAIDGLRQAINKELFLSLTAFEAHFGVYPPGAFYKKHLDQFKKVKARLISCVLYLNLFGNQEDGGQLRIYHGADSDAFTDIYPLAGRLVCFRSDMIYHEVLPAGKERFSLTGWLKKSSNHLEA